MINQINYSEKLDSKQKIIHIATKIANREGVEAISIKSIANELKFSSPAIYKHYSSLKEIVETIALNSYSKLLQLTKDSLAGRTEKEAIMYLSYSYRNFSKKFPGEFLLTIYRGKKERKEFESVRKEFVEIFSRVFISLKVPKSKIIFCIRAYRSFIFGFLILENQKSFGLPENSEKSFKEGIEIFLRGIIFNEGKYNV